MTDLEGFPQTSCYFSYFDLSPTSINTVEQLVYKNTVCEISNNYVKWKAPEGLNANLEPK